ncbi:hypothetical protein VTJ04DRAFT_9272 [Mycothermus thermophilus]|uniref:uncharacterized protein n=1 Tax=Humicola insolens TaxID=85995 RepID=UPI003743A2DD
MLGLEILEDAQLIPDTEGVLRKQAPHCPLSCIGVSVSLEGIVPFCLCIWIDWWLARLCVCISLHLVATLPRPPAETPCLCVSRLAYSIQSIPDILTRHYSVHISYIPRFDYPLAHSLPLSPSRSFVLVAFSVYISRISSHLSRIIVGFLLHLGASQQMPCLTTST